MAAAALEAHLPHYHHRSRHDTLVDADPATTWDSLLAFKTRELRTSRALSAIRALPTGSSDGLSRILDEPFVAAFPDVKGFAVLDVDAPRMMVIGAVMRPWLRAPEHTDVLSSAAFAGFTVPGWVRTAMSFEVEAAVDGGTRLATETRIEATSAEAARRFARYWLIIRAGSGLIRRDVLRTAARHAEARDEGPIAA